MPTELIDAFLAGDTDAAIARLADDATFHSPVADYTGRARIAKVWGAVAEVVTDAQADRVLVDGDRAVAFFTGTAAGRPIDGVVHAVGSPVADVTLMVRPLDALLPAVERMKDLLAR
jgi:ketosteroid isomerase-like protein